MISLYAYSLCILLASSFRIYNKNTSKYVLFVIKCKRKDTKITFTLKN